MRYHTIPNPEPVLCDFLKPFGFPHINWYEWGDVNCIVELHLIALIIYITIAMLQKHGKAKRRI